MISCPRVTGAHWRHHLHMSSDYLTVNEKAWTKLAESFVEAGEKSWASEEAAWGVFGIPESEAGLLTENIEGKKTIELGCGTGYVSAWLARRGAIPTGIDLTEAQLATARRLQDVHGLHFPLFHGNAEATPFEDESFDFAISEYGAAIWCDPYKWIPEAARILKPGGALVFLANGLLTILTQTEPEDAPDSVTLKRDYFGLHRVEWFDDPPSVEFHLGIGDWIRLFRANGFEVEDFIELRASPEAETRYDYITASWASRWPCEQAWKLRKKG